MSSILYAKNIGIYTSIALMFYYKINCLYVEENSQCRSAKPVKKKKQPNKNQIYK